MNIKQRDSNELSYQVKDIALAADVSTDAVRYYTKSGLLKPTRNKNNQYKLYNHNDLVRLQFIRRAKTLGYSISEIKKILGDSEKGKSPCPRVRHIIENKITANKQHLIETLALQKRMEKALKIWQGLPDGIPVGDSICHLIEQVTK